MLLDSDDESDRIEFENESDVDENDCVEVRSINSDSVQDIPSNEREGSKNGNEVNTKEEYFLEKDKVTKWKKTNKVQLGDSRRIFCVNY